MGQGIGEWAEGSGSGLRDWDWEVGQGIGKWAEASGSGPRDWKVGSAP